MTAREIFSLDSLNAFDSKGIAGTKTANKLELAFHSVQKGKNFVLTVRAYR